MGDGQGRSLGLVFSAGGYLRQDAAGDGARVPVACLGPPSGALTGEAELEERTLQALRVEVNDAFETWRAAERSFGEGGRSHGSTPRFEDFGRDFAARGISGHGYWEGLWHGAQRGLDWAAPVETGAVVGKCPRRDRALHKPAALPWTFALVVALRRANAGALDALRAALVARSVDAGVADAVVGGAFRDVAVQIHEGTPVTQAEAARSIRHSDTAMSLLHASVTLDGERGVLFELFPQPQQQQQPTEAPAPGTKAGRRRKERPVPAVLRPTPGYCYITCPTAAFHYPFYPHRPRVVALQLRILSPEPDALARLYRGDDYGRGVGPQGKAAIAAVHQCLERAAWRMPTHAEVCEAHAALFGPARGGTGRGVAGLLQ